MARARGSRASTVRPARRRIPLERHLALRVRRRWLRVAALLVLAILLVAADRRGWLLYAGDDWARYQGRSWQVTRVVDGDTLVIDAPDGRAMVTRVRLWGVNAPEIARRGLAADPFADEAHALARRLCEGQQVVLHLEAHQLRDRFNRLLAYVELPDGTLLNESLLLAGLATADDRFSHRHLQRFIVLQEQARRHRRGLWSRDPPRRPR